MINEDDIMQFKESETIELKKSLTQLKDGIISISAILNKHNKGKLYFGIDNSGKIVGQTINEKTVRDIEKSISDSIEPKIFPKIEKKILENKEFIEIDFQGDKGPYSAYGRYFIRVADSDKQMTKNELQKQFSDINSSRWGALVCENATIEDISEKKLMEFCKLSDLIYDSKINVLNKLNLLKNEIPLNAAILFFATAPEKYIPNARLRCATFATTDTVSPIDMQDYSGDLFELIQKAETYILSHINVGMRLEGMRRIDVPEIDKDAFREAIINAFCHRDYTQYDSVNIAVFRDRVEIRNPGNLYRGLTIKDIIKRSVSERRNELIADIFHRVHFVENWGTGIKKILKLEPTAKFELIVDFEFRSIFTRSQKQNYLDNIPSWPPKVTEKVTENQDKIISLILKNSKITIKELSITLNISPKNVKENLSKLKQKEMLERVGPDKGGYWKIIKKIKE